MRGFFVITTILVVSFVTGSAMGGEGVLSAEEVAWIEASVAAEEGKVVDWRRSIHQHPELGRFEFRTSKLVGEHMRSLGIEVQSKVAKTGVVGILKGALPGPVMALRADMDALPIKEETGLSFASKSKADYFGRSVDVMHACGHDSHVAMLMGAAEILAKNRDKLAGTVVFIFQPAEEGAADIDDFTSEEHYGARQMVEEGVLSKHGVDVVFALHVISRFPYGEYIYRSGAILSSVDNFRISVKGQGTHGSMPWTGTDAILSSAHIVDGVQSLVSRRVNLLSGAGVVSFGTINGGAAANVIPNVVEMTGTMRASSAEIRRTLLSELPEMVELIARADRTAATVQMAELYPVTFNDPALTAAMMPILGQLNGGRLTELPSPLSASEDFSFYAEKVPGLYVFLGVSNSDNARDIGEDASPHNSKFMPDERAFKSGVAAHLAFVLGYPKLAGLKEKSKR